MLNSELPGVRHCACICVHVRMNGGLSCPPLQCCSLLIGHQFKCCCCTISQIDGTEGESQEGGGGGTEGTNGRRGRGGGQGIMQRREQDRKRRGEGRVTDEWLGAGSKDA